MSTLERDIEDKDKLAELTAERDALRLEVDHLREQGRQAEIERDRVAGPFYRFLRILTGPLDATRAEVAALEPGKLAADAAAIDLWNRLESARLTAEENRQLRGLVDQLKAMVAKYQDRDRLLVETIGLAIEAERGDAATFEALGFPDLGRSTNARVDQLQGILDAATGATP